MGEAGLSLPAAQCIARARLSSARAFSTCRCSAVRSRMIETVRSGHPGHALASARIDRSWSSRRPRTIFPNSVPSAGSVSGMFTFRTPAARHQAVELLVGRVAEVEDRVSPSDVRERRVLGGGVGARWPLRKSRPYRTRRPSTVGRTAHVAELRTPASRARSAGPAAALVRHVSSSRGAVGARRRTLSRSELYDIGSR